MYNRYIPQPDGSFRRSRIPDPPIQRHAPTPQLSEEICQDPPQKNSCKSDPVTHPDSTKSTEKKYIRNQNYAVKRPQRHSNPARNANGNCKKEASSDEDSSIGNFFRNLLPKDFDTGDLLVVLLLLLMSGDCAEDQNSALLTLVLYMFM